MKLKTLEKTIGYSILFLLLLKLSNIYSWPFLIFLLGFVISILYYTMTIGIFRDNKLNKPYKNPKENKHQTVLSVLIGFGIATITTGFSWYIMAMPDNNLILILGNIILSILTLYLVFIKKHLEPVFVKSALKRGMIYIGIGLILTLIPKNTFLKIQYRNHPEFVEAVIELQKNPKDSILLENVHRIQNEMNE